MDRTSICGVNGAVHQGRGPISGQTMQVGAHTMSRREGGLERSFSSFIAGDQREMRDFPVRIRDCRLSCQKRDCPVKIGTVGSFQRRIIQVWDTSSRNP
ncbi:hypothetical protein XENTR_v10016422 [Xenopus tropicalis]|nr:hypothetical protein XENTR_v10016422 [Xenopus tropicalis]